MDGIMENTGVAVGAVGILSFFGANLARCFFIVRCCWGVGGQSE